MPVELDLAVVVMVELSQEIQLEVRQELLILRLRVLILVEVVVVGGRKQAMVVLVVRELRVIGEWLVDQEEITLYS